MKKTLLAVEAMTTGLKHLNEAAQANGVKLTMLAENPSMYGENSGVEIIKFPTRDYNQLCEYVTEHQNDIENIFSPTDTWGLSAARLREKFGYRQTIDIEKLQKFCDKKWVKEQLGQTRESSSHYIIKPRFGTGSMQVQLANSQEKVEEIFTNNEFDRADFVIEPYHVGANYSAEVWCDSKQFVFFGVTNRIMSKPPVFVELVKSFPHCANTEWEAHVSSWIKELLDKLDYDLGFAHIEFVETNGGFELIEINARIPGALITPSINQMTNYNPYHLIIESALGLDVNLPESRDILGGYSHVSIYAEKIGKLKSVSFPFELSEFPGELEWYPAKSIGDEVSYLNDYRARIGNLAAKAANPSLAQDYAIAAASTIMVEIDDEKI